MKKATFALVALLPFTHFAMADDYTLEVNGLQCQHCADSLERKLQTLDGVQSVQFDLSAKRVDVATAQGQELTQDQLEEAVKASGFTLVKVESASNEQ